MHALDGGTDLLIGDVFETALALLSERSYREFTHQEVGERAEADVRLVQERWPRPADLIMDALLDAIGPVPSEPPDEGSLRVELVYVTTWMAREFAAHGDLLVRIMSQLRDNPELDQAFRERFLAPRIECGRKVLGRAMLRGDLRPEVDPRMMLRLVPALMTYRVLLRDPMPDAQLAELLVDTVLLPLLVRNDSR
ncbi:TetR-like C-terminal domain-containing protein [Actinomadura scrupuli]|uniref:TetR-like C-terminal domain-containing protein n=1 Tax=Actinomadura scrupuli TaxID=559629 RepID=UPI003D999ADF